MCLPAKARAMIEAQLQDQEPISASSRLSRAASSSTVVANVSMIVTATCDSAVVPAVMR